MRKGVRCLLLSLVQITIGWLPGLGSPSRGIISESEEMLRHLAQHHPDFLRIKVVIHSQLEDGRLRCLLTSDGSRVLDTTFLLQPEDHQRTLFEGLSGPALRPKNPTVNPSLLSWLGVAWYWDYRVLKAPVFFDTLADIMRGGTDLKITPAEARAFWYYRYQLTLHRNRQELHQSWIDHPDRLQRLGPEETWTDEESLQIYAFMDLRMSPILSPSESLDLLHTLQIVPAFGDDTSESILSDPCLLSESNKNTQSSLLQNRLDLIRKWILHINPIALNALRSLGIAYEHALLENHAEVQKAWIQYLEDFKLVEEVVSLLPQMEIDPWKCRIPYPWYQRHLLRPSVEGKQSLPPEDVLHSNTPKE